MGNFLNICVCFDPKCSVDGLTGFPDTETTKSVIQEKNFSNWNFVVFWYGTLEYTEAPFTVTGAESALNRK